MDMRHLLIQDIRLFVLFAFLTVTNGLNTDHDYKIRENFWESLAPGELLNVLDLMTVDGTQNTGQFKLITSTLQPVTLKPITSTEKTLISTSTTPSSTSESIEIKRKAKNPRKRMITNVDSDATSGSIEQDNYDHSYEDFVKRYFTDAADHYISSNEDYSSELGVTDEAITNASTDISYETDDTVTLDAQPFGTTAKKTKDLRKNKKSSPENSSKKVNISPKISKTSSKNAKSAKSKCHKVYRKHEVCIICKNPRNGERSETCSYESSIEPQSYAYEKEKSYKKSRDRHDDSEENDNDEDDVTKSDVNDSKESTSETRIQLTNIKPTEIDTVQSDLSVSCTKGIASGKACYYCKDSRGVQQSVKCFQLSPQVKNNVRSRRPIALKQNLKVKDSLQDQKHGGMKSIQQDKELIPTQMMNKTTRSSRIRDSFTPRKPSIAKLNETTHQKRRIYKRTLSYVYEKDLNSNETPKLSTEIESNIAIT